MFQVWLHAPMRRPTRESYSKQGYIKVPIRTVYTDVLVLAVTAAPCLDVSELWVAFGVGKCFRNLPAHVMARKLGPERCVALPMFHAFTWCDTVSSFGGRGKKTAWKAWDAYDAVTPAFCALASTPAQESIEDWLELLERYVILLYDHTSTQGCVNQAQKELFTQKGRTMDGIPPTQAALLQHTKRAAYQAGHCWGQVMIASSEPHLQVNGLETECHRNLGLTLVVSSASHTSLSRTSAPWLQEGEGLQRTMQMPECSTPVHRFLKMPQTLCWHLTEEKHLAMWLLL